MNKNDKRLVVFLLIIFAFFFLFFILCQKNGRKVAIIYYENKIIQTIDLEQQGLHRYTVEGYNGSIILETQKGKIRVVEENSPKHLCSKQGYINTTYQSIVCLPNKIIIKIESEEKLDTVVR